MNKDVKGTVRKLVKEGFRVEHRGGRQGSTVLIGPAGDTITISDANDAKRVERWAEGQRRVVEDIGPIVVEAKTTQRSRDLGDLPVNVAANRRKRSLRAFDYIEREARMLLPDDRDRLLKKLGWIP